MPSNLFEIDVSKSSGIQLEGIKSSLKIEKCHGCTGQCANDCVVSKLSARAANDPDLAKKLQKTERTSSEKEAFALLDSSEPGIQKDISELLKSEKTKSKEINLDSIEERKLTRSEKLELNRLKKAESQQSSETTVSSSQFKSTIDAQQARTATKTEGINYELYRNRPQYNASSNRADIQANRLDNNLRQNERYDPFNLKDKQRPISETQKIASPVPEFKPQIILAKPQSIQSEVISQKISTLVDKTLDQANLLSKLLEANRHNQNKQSQSLSQVEAIQFHERMKQIERAIETVVKHSVQRLKESSATGLEQAQISIKILNAMKSESMQTPLFKDAAIKTLLEVRSALTTIKPATAKLVSKKTEQSNLQKVRKNKFVATKISNLSRKSKLGNAPESTTKILLTHAKASASISKMPVKEKLSVKSRVTKNVETMDSRSRVERILTTKPVVTKNGTSATSTFRSLGSDRKISASQKLARTNRKSVKVKTIKLLNKHTQSLKLNLKNKRAINSKAASSVQRPIVSSKVAVNLMRQGVVSRITKILPPKLTVRLIAVATKVKEHAAKTMNVIKSIRVPVLTKAVSQIVKSKIIQSIIAKIKPLLSKEKQNKTSAINSKVNQRNFIKLKLSKKIKLAKAQVAAEEIKKLFNLQQSDDPRRGKKKLNLNQVKEAIHKKLIEMKKNVSKVELESLLSKVADLDQAELENFIKNLGNKELKDLSDLVDDQQESKIEFKNVFLDQPEKRVL